MAEYELSEKDIDALFAQANNTNRRAPRAWPDQVERLMSGYRAWTEIAPPLQPGDIVQWKPEFIGQNQNAYRDAAIVLEVLPEPIESDVTFHGRLLRKERADVVIGELDGQDDELMVVYTDQRRLRRVFPLGDQ